MEIQLDVRDYLHIGPVPAEEKCEQVGPSCDYAKMKRECNAFIAAIRTVCGPEPDGANLKLLRQEHDFGSYYEVVCWYDKDNEEARGYAFRVEAEAPNTWADAGMTAPE